MGITPGYSQTIPPPRLASPDQTARGKSRASPNAAIEITVSPAPETSAIDLMWAGWLINSLPLHAKTPYSDSVIK